MRIFNEATIAAVITGLVTMFFVLPSINRQLHQVVDHRGLTRVRVLVAILRWVLLMLTSAHVFTAFTKADTPWNHLAAAICTFLVFLFVFVPVAIVRREDELRAMSEAPDIESRP